MKHGIEGMSKALRERITSYLANNDSLTPEQVSDLFRDCRRALAAAPAMKRVQSLEQSRIAEESHASFRGGDDFNEREGPDYEIEGKEW